MLTSSLDTWEGLSAFHDGRGFPPRNAKVSSPPLCWSPFFKWNKYSTNSWPSGVASWSSILTSGEITPMNKRQVCRYPDKWDTFRLLYNPSRQYAVDFFSISWCQVPVLESWAPCVWPVGLLTCPPHGHSTVSWAMSTHVCKHQISHMFEPKY